ncbi:MAG: carboxylesterase family protein [Steroidobacteraceae bacterium]|jgi:para-nitrobenzyl esterase
MRSQIAVLIVAVASASAVRAAASSAPLLEAPPIVVTDAGAISGISERGLAIFKGVPYAAAPVGELRWRPPAAHARWRDTRKADEFAPACMQQGVSMPGETPPPISEDCLFLNIWAPNSRARRHLPVIVWIHGGGYRNGSAAMPLYWGDRLAAKGVIVVTIAYRLGPLGFLALPELSRESPLHTSGNYGLMDQIAALEWVHRNIGAFGGDAARVTIAGQSSGAISVSVLMASPRAKGRFSRAIAESGGLFEPLQLAPGYLLVNAERDGEKFAASLHASSLAELRRLPATDLLGGDDAGGVTHPVIEPSVLPRSPSEAFALGSQNDVPLLVGSNADEARSLTDASHTLAATFDAEINHSFGALPPAILDAYPHGTDAQAPQARLDLERDLRFAWDMWAWARLQAATGREPVYYYSFEQQPPFPPESIYAGWGASHFAELWYVFNHLDQAPWAWTRADRQLAETLSSYWVNFARSGNPNGPGLPVWPAFSGAQHTVQYLGDPIHAGGVANIDRLEVLDAVYSAVRGKPLILPMAPAKSGT